MRIGIYNRWLHTFGGGERETGAFARVWQADHSVDLLTHQPVALDLFADRLNLQLSKVNVRLLPFDPAYEAVVTASKDYDLFLDISHGDIFAPAAKHNLLRVFFPGRPATADELHAAADAPRLELLHGFYQPEQSAGRLFAWTGARAEVRLVPRAHLPGKIRAVEVVLHGWRPPGAPPANVRLLVDGAPVATRRLPPDGRWGTWNVPLPAPLQTEPIRLIFETTTFNPYALGSSDDVRDLGIALASVGLHTGAWGRFWTTLQDTVVPDHAAYTAMLARQTLVGVRGYDRLLANSYYTQHWIARRWGLPSNVLYPPVDIASFATGPKRQRILSVGRFFAGSHNKKHLALIAAFRALYDAGLRDWEYHLAGGCDETMPEHRAYLEQVRAAARGYPITVHANIAWDELRALYASAAIFWHATGLGEDEARAPESFEHFGISTVEAMAAGCVPVVIAKAGQLEIVAHGVDGYLWQTLEELQVQTRALARDPALRSHISQAARRKSLSFDTERFNREARALAEE